MRSKRHIVNANLIISLLFLKLFNNLCKQPNLKHAQNSLLQVNLLGSHSSHSFSMPFATRPFSDNAPSSYRSCLLSISKSVLLCLHLDVSYAFFGSQLKSSLSQESLPYHSGYQSFLLLVPQDWLTLLCGTPFCNWHGLWEVNWLMSLFALTLP